MKNFKKIAAIILTGTMVMGSSVAVFAETETGAKSSNGTAASTGHIDTEIVNVVYPIEVANTTFSYIMDSERLVRATSKYKSASVTLTPSEEDDTGVYFLTAENTYGNTSKALEVTNKSSVDVDVTAKVVATVEEGKTMVDLADSADVSDTALELYLGLKVGDTETAVTDDENGVTATASVEGYADNYVITSESNGSYTYAMKASPDDTKWSKTTISLTGAVSAVSNDDELVGPNVAVTWSAAKKATDAAPSIANTAYTVDGTEDVDIALNLGAGSLAATNISGITFTSTSGDTKTLGTTSYSVSGTTLTISKDQVTAWINAGLSSRTYSIKFNDTAETTVAITLTKDTE